jgi:protein TonB
MFEDSLVVSRVARISSSERWTAVASIGLQCALASVVVVLPLMHPERMVSRVEAPKVVMPLLRKAPVPVRVERAAAASSASPTAASASSPTRRLIFTTAEPTSSVPDVASAVSFGNEMKMGDGVPSGLGDSGTGTRPVVVVRPEANRRVPISSGVSAGLLLVPIRPVYPAIARAAGVQGTVVVSAVISRTGTIESLRVVSGPAMLQTAAVEAIRAARYQPYRLNGMPTEVETTITVNFRLGA